MKKKVLVRGPALSRSGYGEHARFVLRALRAHEKMFDIYLLNIPWGRSGWICENNEEREWLDGLLQKTMQHQKDGLPYDISLQVTIPNEWEKLAPVNIGVTAGIETTKVAPEWIEKSSVVDKIIIVSEHSKNVYLNTSYDKKDNNTGKVEKNFRCKTPIDVVGYPVRMFEPDPSFELALSTEFNFLTIAQWGPRKNLENTIKWFVEEFIDQEVGLIVKTSVKNDSLRDRRETENKLKNLLSKYPQRKCKVYLLHGTLSDNEMSALYNNKKVKALVSFSHGEGFGLPIFEAAYNDLPVIAPAWSGQCDFLFKPVKSKSGKIKNKAMFAKVEYDISQIQKEARWDGVVHKDSMWCFPKQGSCKMKLREVYRDFGRYKSQAKKLGKYIRETFTKEQKYLDLAKSVLGPEFIKPKDFNGVTFCIPTNGKKIEKTKITIEALKNQITTKEVEIIVAGVVEPFKDIDGVRLAEASDVANNGYLAELRNIAARESTKEVLCYLDDDMILPPNWLWRLEEYSRNVGWDVLGNRILNPDGSRLWDRAIMNPHVLVPYNHPSIDRNLYQTGGFSIHRKSVFEQQEWDGTIPVYAEKYGKENEDIEYSKRLHSNGYVIKFDPENVTWHWDENYTQVFLSDGMSQTLRKDVIIEHMGEQKFPEACDEFKNVLSVFGVEV